LKRVIDFLTQGKENAVPADRLAALVGCKSVRELQELIALERKDGSVILSASTGGYYLPSCKQEIREFIVTLENRGENTLAALKSAKQALADSKEGDIDGC